LGLAVAGDLLVLGFFKYYSFFAQDVDDTLNSIGMGVPAPLITVLLPIGISFFTFQAISYVVDVKRRLVKPASLIDCAIYLSFFPHLVAGPIVRAREFLPQLASPRDPDRVAVGAGLGLIGLGLVKKVAIADYLGRTIVNPVFDVPQAHNAPDALMATYGFAAQIYCDFSGYTDIAIGLALLMGFIFPQNFNSPYRATGFRDFWRRWHMTLSRFLRDFLYIPAGRQPRQPPVHLPQPDDHDAARRPLARRRLALRPSGAAFTASGWSRSTRSTGGSAAAPRPGCAASSPSTSSASAGSSSAARALGCSGTSSSASRFWWAPPFGTSWASTAAPSPAGWPRWRKVPAGSVGRAPLPCHLTPGCTGPRV